MRYSRFNSFRNAGSRSIAAIGHAGSQAVSHYENAHTHALPQLTHGFRRETEYKSGKYVVVSGVVKKQRWVDGPLKELKLRR